MIVLVSREVVEEKLHELVDDWDAEDASHLVDILLERYTLQEAWSWLMFPDASLGGTPLALLEGGCARQVLRRARTMVADGS